MWKVRNSSVDDLDLSESPSISVGGSPEDTIKIRVLDESRQQSGTGRNSTRTTARHRQNIYILKVRTAQLSLLSRNIEQPQWIIYNPPASKTGKITFISIKLFVKFRNHQACQDCVLGSHIVWGRSLHHQQQGGPRLLQLAEAGGVGEGLRDEEECGVRAPGLLQDIQSNWQGTGMHVSTTTKRDLNNWYKYKY